MNPKELTGCLFTDATRQIDCPRCMVVAGEYCRGPSGLVTFGKVPHTERTKSIVDAVGTIEPWQGARALAAWKKQITNKDALGMT
jgi:hypothetical protein